ncbi:uncharacterized protein [Ptychodera flava]|uniref:uncharacterized protein n=1 Tax=Ptychodera flava TaxID=63121 RepID=UPI003969CC5C
MASNSRESQPRTAGKMKISPFFEQVVFLFCQKTVVEGTYEGPPLVGVTAEQKLVTRYIGFGGEWQEVPDSCCVIRTEIMNDGTVLGVGEDGLLYTKSGLYEGQWTAVEDSCCIQDVAVTANGTIVAISSNKRLKYRSDLNVGWARAPRSWVILRVDTFGDGRLAGVSQRGNLKFRDGLNGRWKTQDKRFKLLDIAIQPDDTLLGINNDTCGVHLRDSVTGDWGPELWDSSDLCVISIAAPGVLGQGDTLHFMTPYTDVAVQASVPEMTDMTMCLWEKATAESPDYAALVSYSIEGEANEILLSNTVSLDLFIESESSRSDLFCTDGSWHHVCVTWSSGAGAWALYDNGQLYESGSDLEAGHIIGAGGVLILGQDQDETRGGYDEEQAFIGCITGFNMWSRVLSAQEITQVTSDCSIGGDVFTWDVMALDFVPNMNAFIRSATEFSPTVRSLELATAYSNVAVQASVPEMTDMTMCLWEKATAESPDYAALVSYSIEGEANEVLLSNTVSLDLYIESESSRSDLFCTDGSWHHVCVTWSSAAGTWALYDNGQLYESGSGLNPGHVIGAGGVLVLGQDQDETRGGYDAEQAFIGSITGFNMWSRVLSAQEVSQVNGDCSVGGDVFSWNTEYLDIPTEVGLVKGDVC